MAAGRLVSMVVAWLWHMADANASGLKFLNGMMWKCNSLDVPGQACSCWRPQLACFAATICASGIVSMYFLKASDGCCWVKRIRGTYVEVALLNLETVVCFGFRVLTFALLYIPVKSLILSFLKV